MRTEEERLKLFEENMGLAYKFSDKYTKNNIKEFKDVLQCAFIGLWNATKSYNECKGTKFTTFASSHIVGEILNYINRFFLQKKRGVGKANIPLSLDSKAPNSQSDESFTYWDIASYSNASNSVEEELNEMFLKEFIIEEARSIKENEKNKKMNDIDKIVELKLEGMSTKDISAKLDISVTYVNVKLRAFKEYVMTKL